MMQTITWKGRLGPMDLTASDTTFLPSTISQLMAAVLDVKPGDIVIDVGCGTGVLGIIAAKLGASKVYGVDASPDVVEVATANARAHGVADRMEFFHGDLFSPLGDDITADVIIGDVSGIPDDLAADSGWFPSKTGGGPRGSELPIRMLQQAKRRLAEGGRLFLPTGTLQDENAILDAARSRVQPREAHRTSHPAGRCPRRRQEHQAASDDGIVQLSEEAPGCCGRPGSAVRRHPRTEQPGLSAPA